MAAKGGRGRSAPRPEREQIPRRVGKKSRLFGGVPGVPEKSCDAKISTRDRRKMCQKIPQECQKSPPRTREKQISTRGVSEISGGGQSESRGGVGNWQALAAGVPGCVSEAHSGRWRARRLDPRRRAREGLAGRRERADWVKIMSGGCAAMRAWKYSRFHRRMRLH